MIQLEERLYTSTEVAEILGVSLRSVYRYLEEGKLNAEIKTATGRHRFSKSDILDFLYPGEQKEQTKKTSSASKVEAEQSPKPITSDTPEVKVSSDVKKEADKDEDDVQTFDAQIGDSEEPVDWLAKFREAAQKFREENEALQKDAVTANKVETEEKVPVHETYVESSAFVQESKNTISGISESAVMETRESEPKTSLNFYRSGLGGLKDVAQNLDKSARKSDLDYAFTLNAGLSLYQPIKPFSVLHAYVRPADQVYFEKMLSLTPTDERNAQLCLLLSNNADVYERFEELHGLKVVDKETLAADVRALGDDSLRAEAENIL